MDDGPHAVVDESRDPWRKEMYELCLPLVKDCKTPGEAAQRLNATLYAKLKVKYSTQRMKANQSPKESIAQGLASCWVASTLFCQRATREALGLTEAWTPLGTVAVGHPPTGDEPPAQEPFDVERFVRFLD